MSFFLELHNNIIALLCPSSKRKFMVPPQLTSYNKISSSNRDHRQ